MPKGTRRRRPMRKPGQPRHLRPRTVRRVLCQKGPQCKRKRRTRHRKRKAARRKGGTRRRQRGGQATEEGCTSKGGDWEWVPGARSAEFDRYYDCDLAVPGPGGCCRKIGAGQEKCPVCFDVFPRDEMMPRNHLHKTCADCWEAIGTNQCPVCREQVGERSAAAAALADGPEPDFERLRHAPIQAPRRPIAPAAAPARREEPVWVRRGMEEMEMEQRREEQRELEERLWEDQMREEEAWRLAEQGPEMGYDPMNPDGEGGGYWWWPF